MIDFSHFSNYRDNCPVSWISFLASLSDDQILDFLAHEISHLLLGVVTDFGCG